MSELIRQFGIDWRLLLAQAVNFGALFFILYRFAYRPILAMLEERRQGIREGVRMREEARQKLAAAAREREAILQKTERESLAMIAEAEKAGVSRGSGVLREAEKKKEDLLAEAKRRAGQERLRLAEAFHREAEDLVRSAVAKLAQRNPSAIDANLVKQALAELKHVGS